MKRQTSFLLIMLLTMLSSCSKNGSDTNTGAAPTGLTVVANISTDNSGNVSFTSTATNAVTYDYDFGNGIFQTVTTGLVTYKYPSSGTYTVNVIAKSATGQTVSKSIQVTVTVAMSLVWSDEFNTSGAPDPSKWGYDLGAGGWGNNELEYYTNRPENAVVQNGVLKITALKETYNGSPYTSARLLSKGKFAFKYGKVEASAKLPAGIGSWPAIWMLGNNISTVPWPGCGEIDIMEHRGSELNRIFGTLHYPGHSGANGDGNTKLITTASTAFHKYGLEWNAATIKISVDDQVFYTFANSSTTPFNLDFFLIMNVAMGGDFGGTVDPTITTATMEVDYIRVYN